MSQSTDPQGQAPLTEQQRCRLEFELHQIRCEIYLFRLELRASEIESQLGLFESACESPRGSLAELTDEFAAFADRRFEISAPPVESGAERESITPFDRGQGGQNQESNELCCDRRGHDTATLEPFNGVKLASEIGHVSNISDLSEMPLNACATKKKKRTAALVTSAMVHLTICVVFAVVSLSPDPTRDRITITARDSEASSPSFDSIAISQNEVVFTPQTPQAVPVDEQVDARGELAFAIQPPFVHGEVSDIAPLITRSDDAPQILDVAETKVVSNQFCGVDGGGNHFVYLIDSSASMGDAFVSARDELIRSINSLSEGQRFYVVFFDSSPDFMKFDGATLGSSVYATTENKLKFQQWATQVSPDRGKAPYEAIRFALRLRPDVIFLLSDGEFPQGIEDLLANENKIENLFGDTGPIAIVHTIAYHSKEGEIRMRRIAMQNQGQYRYIRKR